MLNGKHPTEFLKETLAELGPLSGVTLTEEEWATMPALRVLSAVENCRVGGGCTASKGVPWQMASNRWYPNWGEILRGPKAAVDSITKSRRECLLDLLRLMDLRFRCELTSLGGVHDRDPNNFLMYTLRGEFLLETSVIGASLMPGQCVAFIDACYAFVPKEKLCSSKPFESTAVTTGKSSKAETCDSLATGPTADSSVLST